MEQCFVAFPVAKDSDLGVAFLSAKIKTEVFLSFSRHSEIGLSFLCLENIHVHWHLFPCYTPTLSLQSLFTVVFRGHVFIEKCIFCKFKFYSKQIFEVLKNSTLAGLSSDLYGMKSNSIRLLLQ